MSQYCGITPRRSPPWQQPPLQQQRRDKPAIAAFTHLQAATLEKRSNNIGETEQLSLHLAPATITRIGAANPNSGERLCAPRVRLLLDSQTGQLVNTGQLVKTSSQLWSNLQKWLNKRSRIGNWTEIKLLIN